MILQNDINSKITIMLKVLINMTEIKHLIQVMISKLIKQRVNDNKEKLLNCEKKSVKISLPFILKLNLLSAIIQLKQLNIKK